MDSDCRNNIDDLMKVEFTNVAGDTDAFDRFFLTKTVQGRREARALFGIWHLLQYVYASVLALFAGKRAGDVTSLFPAT